MTKRWYRSRTLWFNALCAALAALEGLTGVLQPYMPVNAFALLSIVLPVGNAVLRVITTDALGK